MKTVADPLETFINERKTKLPYIATKYQSTCADTIESRTHGCQDSSYWKAFLGTVRQELRGLASKSESIEDTR